MDKNKLVIKIFLLSQPILNTEWASLLGHKYAQALPFPWEFTQSLEEAHIVAWDGVLTPKLMHYQDRILNKLKSGTILLLQGEARTFLENHPFVKLISLDQLSYVELPGWSVLPEELLMALSACQQKISHV
jgi:hypothetical protein